MFSHNIWDDETIDIGPLEPVGGLPDERHLSKSAMRALDVLDYFSRLRRPARAVEIAESLGLHPSSADQLLKTMVSRAYLMFDVRRKLYHPSPRLLGFATFIGNTYFGGPNLQTLMGLLQDSSGYAVALSAPFGRFMQLIDFVASPGQGYGREPGYLFPLFGSAVGSAILANWPIASVRAIIAQSRDQIGALAVDADTILDRLNEVRQDGHAFGGMSRQAEACSIAVALPPARFGTELTVSLRGPTAEIGARRWRLAAMMHDAIAAHLKDVSVRPSRCVAAKGA